MRLVQLITCLSLLALPAFAQDEAGASSEPVRVQPVAVSDNTASAARPQDPAGLQAALALLSQDPVFASASVAAQVVDTKTGAEVWSWGGDRLLRPASTMKLLTAAVAMRTLGPQYRFPTWIMTDQEPVGGVLAGNLYVKGQGDPTMVVERMYRMLLDVKMRGITEIDGDVIFDDSYFQDSAEIPGWDSDEDRKDGPTYFAPLGALSVNFNIAAVTVHGGKAPGDPAVVSTDTPSPGVIIDNRIVTGSAKSRTAVSMGRSVDSTGKIVTFRLTGTWNIEREPEVWRKSISDPLTQYMGTFHFIADQLGIKVKGAYRPGLAPTAAKVFYRFDSEPLAEILADMNKLSQNFFAEQVLRAVGAETRGLPGTTAKGAQTVADYLDSLGVPKSGYTLVNGSGLSRGVLLTPSTMDKVLVDMWNSPEVGTEFVYTLSVGGRDGTLRARFKEDELEGRVRGKTGTLSGVSCLAGYVEAMDGHTYAFTIFVNDVGGAISRAKRAHDRLVRTVAGTTGNIADTTDADDGSN